MRALALAAVLVAAIAACQHQGGLPGSGPVIVESADGSVGFPPLDGGLFDGGVPQLDAGAFDGGFDAG